MIRLIVLLGIAARFADAWHPTDARCSSCWRESDLTQVARNWYRDGGGYFYPRVDWCEDKSGYVEMELPLLSWLGAISYKIFGYHEQILRLWSSVFSAGSMALFAWLAWRAVPPAGALLATAMFAANGLLITTSSAIQPESPMLFFSIAGMLAIDHWIKTDRRSSFLIACLFVGIAACCKGPAVHLGLVLLFYVPWKKGLYGAAMDPISWCGAAIAGGLPWLWYRWSHHFYMDTGLSLGLSDETHLVSWQAARDLSLYITLIRIEVVDVFAGVGLLFAAAACCLSLRQSLFALVWYASVCVFYFISLDTSGDAWAYYYHILSVPPAALLIGQGFSAVLQKLSSMSPRTHLTGAVIFSSLALLIFAGGCFRSTQFLLRKGGPGVWKMYHAAKELAAYIPEDGKIVVAGSTKFDDHGHPAAFHLSMPFTWMDRKGFVYALEDATPSKIDDIARRGGNYWFVSEDVLTKNDFGRRLQTFEHLATSGGYRLFYVPSSPSQ